MHRQLYTWEHPNQAGVITAGIREGGEGPQRLESARAVSSESRARLRHAVGKRELETRGDELLDVGATDVVGLGDFNNAEDL